MPIIYKIMCLVNEKVYVGSTTNYRRRWMSHRYELKYNKHKCRRLQEAYNNYGSEKFLFEILEDVPVEIYREKEQYWIDFYKAANPDFGFNIMSKVLYGSKTYSYLSEEDVKEIIKGCESGAVRSDMAKKYNVSKQTVSDIAMGRSWTYLPRNKIRWNRWSKISDTGVKKIRDLSKKGISNKDIAFIYDVDPSTISKIISGSKRKEVRYAV